MIDKNKKNDLLQSSVKYSVKNNNLEEGVSDTVDLPSQKKEDLKKDTVGTILNKKRNDMSLTLDDISNTLKIKNKYLEAIESDDFSLLPGITYSIGFIKSYSLFLGLDSNEIIKIYKEQINHNDNKINFEYRENIQMKPLKKRSDFRNYFLIFVIFASVSFLAFLSVKFVFSTFLKNAVMDNSINSKKQDIDNDQQFTVINDTVNMTDVKAVINENPQVSNTTSTDNIDNTTIAISENISNRVYGADNKPTSRVFLKSTGTSWVKLKQNGIYIYDEQKGDVGNGEVIFEGTLHNGDIYYLPNADDLYLTIGNAKYIDLYLDGNKLKALSNVEGMSKLNIEASPNKIINN